MTCTLVPLLSPSSCGKIRSVGSAGVRRPISLSRGGASFEDGIARKRLLWGSAPYKTKQKEVGLKIDLGDFAHTLSVYQISKPSGAADVATNTYAVNGKQRNRGVEWGFFGAPMRGVRLMGGVAYSDPKVTKSIVAANVGKMAKGMPKLQAKLGVEWDTSFVQGLTLTANATAVSKQYIDDLNQKWASGRTTYDLGARYRTKVNNTPVVVRAAVNNVTNKAYWGMPALTSLILGAPRTVSVSASMDF